jgi:hypothetical protein
MSETVHTPAVPPAPAPHRAPRWSRILLAAVCLCTVMFLSAGVLFASAVARSGMVYFTLHEQGGSNVDVAVPAALVHLGIAALPSLAGADVWDDVRTDLGDMRPAAAAVLQALDEAPDAVLVDVQNGRERVRVSKEGQNLRVHVEGPDGVFSIALPAGVLRHIAREVA